MGVEEENQIPFRSQNGVNTRHPEIRQPPSQAFGSPDPQPKKSLRSHLILGFQGSDVSNSNWLLGLSRQKLSEPQTMEEER